jgi:hypothetical protein
MKGSSFLAGLLFCSLIALLGTADAVTYKYIDNAGNIGFADDLQTIPEQYRSQAVLIEGELKEEPASTAATGTVVPVIQSATAAAPAAEQPQAEAPLPPLQGTSPGRPLSMRLLISGGIGIGLLVLVTLIGRLLAGDAQRQVRTYLTTGATVLFLFYLVYAHGKDVLAMVRMAGAAVDDVQRKSAEKGQKAADGIKKLDALFEEMQKAEESFEKEEGAASNR